MVTASASIEKEECGIEAKAEKGVNIDICVFPFHLTKFMQIVAIEHLAASTWAATTAPAFLHLSRS